MMKRTTILLLLFDSQFIVLVNVCQIGIVTLRKSHDRHQQKKKDETFHVVSM